MANLSSVVRRFTNQTMVYWEKIGSDPFGQPVYATPVEMKCRWEDKQKVVILPDGRTVLSKGYILLASDVVESSLVFLGAITDWQALPNYPQVPTIREGGRELILVNSTPDLNGLNVVFEAFI